MRRMEISELETDFDAAIQAGETLLLTGQGQVIAEFAPVSRKPHGAGGVSGASLPPDATETE